MKATEPLKPSVCVQTDSPRHINSEIGNRGILSPCQGISQPARYPVYRIPVDSGSGLPLIPEDLFNLASISMVVSAIALVKRSGGKGRLVSDLAADDPQRGQKLDPVRVEFLRLNSSVDQGSDSVVHKQVGVDLLGDHVR